MRKKVFACAVCAVIGLLAASCAKNEDESNETLRERSFEAWIQLYAPNAEKLDGGIYVEKLKSSEQPGALTPADVGHDQLYGQDNGFGGCGRAARSRNCQISGDV